MQLSAHFTLAESTKSQTASRLGIDNTPDEATIANMKALCEAILEPVREHYGVPVVVNSFYRSPRLNAEVGSKPGSQHVTGEAVDFEVPGVANPVLAEWCRDNLEYDQICLEFVEPGQPSSGWVHASYKAGACRAQCLTINSKGTVEGLIFA